VSSRRNTIQVKGLGNQVCELAAQGLGGRSIAQHLSIKGVTYRMVQCYLKTEPARVLVTEFKEGMKEEVKDSGIDLIKKLEGKIQEMEVLMPMLSYRDRAKLYSVYHSYINLLANLTGFVTRRTETHVSGGVQVKNVLEEITREVKEFKATKEIVHR